MLKKQRDRKNLAIIEAAIKQFFQFGYVETSMDKIAESAQVSKRTVYDHFKTKEQLFEAILITHWNTVFECHGPLFDNNKNIKDNLIHFAKIFMRFLYQPTTISLFRILISENVRFPNLLDNLLQEEQGPFTVELISFIKENIKTNDPELAATFLIGMLKEPHFWPMMLGFTKKTAAKKTLINDAVTTFLKAFS